MYRKKLVISLITVFKGVVVLLIVFNPFLFPTRCFSIEKDSIQIIDACHYSNVFGEMRNYRIFLPKDYDENNPDKKYPVIYFLHGWDQRYFGNGQWAYASYEMGDDNNGDNIVNFVVGHDVIVVKSDGYNRRRDEEYYRSPYNIGGKLPIATYRQFPIYYPELIDYIDANYHTIPDRQHRGISGLSMGGFTASWIGGKYPHLFCAVGNFCGSTEFYVGPQTIPVLYRHLDMFDNYGGMKYRLNNGDEDFIRCYHADVNRVWNQVMDNYEYQMYNADHSPCGLSDMFSFLMNAFSQKLEKPARWDHIDIYPAFSVWGYEVHSDRDVPGFTILENVDENGFRCSVRELLPDGQILSFVNVDITTAPVYKKNTVYVINDINLTTSVVIQKEIKSDSEGRLKIAIDGSLHEIGICETEGKPELAIASFNLVNSGWATPGEGSELLLEILNKGLSAAKNISVEITPTKENVKVLKGKSAIAKIVVNEIEKCETPFKFKVTTDQYEVVQFEVKIKDGDNKVSTQKIEIPVRKGVPMLSEFMIADGKEVAVASAGVDTVIMLLGKGNGDGIANPGESIVVLAKDSGMWRRCQLTFSDKYLNPFGVDQREEDSWTAYDKVGASFKYNVPLIASECPQNHKAELLCEYWLPDYPIHHIKKGKVIIDIKGQDTTPPIFRWVQVKGDNTIMVNIWDGATIKDVKARFVSKRGSETFTDITLNDEGLDGDRVVGDNVYSFTIPVNRFNRYSLLIEASDEFGNKQKYEDEETYILH